MLELAIPALKLQLHTKDEKDFSLMILKAFPTGRIPLSTPCRVASLATLTPVFHSWVTQGSQEAKSMETRLVGSQGLGSVEDLTDTEVSGHRLLLHHRKASLCHLSMECVQPLPQALALNHLCPAFSLTFTVLAFDLLMTSC
jgi:hypothetical protein